MDVSGGFGGEDSGAVGGFSLEGEAELMRLRGKHMREREE